MNRRFLAILLPLVLSVAPAAESGYLPMVSGEVLHANTIDYWMLSFRDVVAAPALVNRQMVFDRIQGKAYGGMIYGRIAIDLPDREATAGYTARFEWARVSLATLLRQLGGNAEELSGEIGGNLDFAVRADHPETMTGRGELTIRKGSLIQLPMLTNLLVGDPGGAKGQDRLDVLFTISDSKVRLTSARLDSPAAQIAIDGTIGFDGDLRLRLEPTFANRLTDAITGGIATLLLNPLTRRAGRFLVRGQITHPVLEANPFGGKGD